jgi:DNA-binding NarL/FixJ family response regulator
MYRSSHASPAPSPARKTVLVIASRHAGWGYVHRALADQSILRVVGEVNDSDAAVEQATIQQPSLVLLAADLRDGRVADLLQRLPLCSPESCVVMFGEELRGDLAEQLQARDGPSYLLWREVNDDSLLPGLLAVLVGHRLFSPDLLPDLVHPEGTSTSDGAPPLDPRERLVLARLMAGWKQTEIAIELKVGRRTVQLDVARLKRKYGVRTIAQLIRAATERGPRL